MKIRNKKLVLTLLYGALGGVLMAQDPAAGAAALETASAEVANFIDPVRNICFAICAICAFVGIITLVIRMYNGEKEVGRGVMIWFGAAIFAVIAAFVIPLMYGVGG